MFKKKKKVSPSKISDLLQELDGEIFTLHAKSSHGIMTEIILQTHLSV